MSSTDDRMNEHIQFTLDLAEKFLQSAGDESHDALLRAVETLAQVILLTTHDKHREEVIDRSVVMLRDYLKLLDAIGRWRDRTLIATTSPHRPRCRSLGNPEAGEGGRVQSRSTLIL